MIIACPECTGPFEVVDAQIAELLQVACPHCRFALILDFAAANDPGLREPGMGTASGYRSEADYRSAAEPPIAATQPMPAPAPPVPVPEPVLAPPAAIALEESDEIPLLRAPAQATPSPAPTPRRPTPAPAPMPIAAAAVTPPSASTSASIPAAPVAPVVEIEPPIVEEDDGVDPYAVSSSQSRAPAARAPTSAPHTPARAPQPRSEAPSPAARAPAPAPAAMHHDRDAALEADDDDDRPPRRTALWLFLFLLVVVGGSVGASVAMTGDPDPRVLLEQLLGAP